MLTVKNLIMLNDLTRLSKDVLRQICHAMDVPSIGHVHDLALRVWKKVKDDRELQNEVFALHQDKILAGRTAVTWYLAADERLSGMKESLIRQHPFNPFERIEIPHPQDQLTETPTLIGAAGTDGAYYLRFMFKTGVTSYFYGSEMVAQPRCSTGTVYVDENSGCVEIRSEARYAARIAASFADLTERSLVFDQQELLAPFAHDVEKVADALSGELVDAVARPELLLANITSQQAKAVVSVLSALDVYFDEGHFDKLQETLTQAKEAFDNEFFSIPFTGLILGGLEKVGMGVSGRDLRGIPMYDFLKPHLQHQGGYIQFKVGGVPYTIRIGLPTNSIYFVTHATESVIKYVRERIFMKTSSHRLK